MGRLCDVGSGYGVWAKGYYLKLDDQGRCTLILTRGKLDQKELIGDKEQQAAILARKDVEIGGEYTLVEAQVAGIAACQWHNLRLRFLGTRRMLGQGSLPDEHPPEPYPGRQPEREEKQSLRSRGAESTLNGAAGPAHRAEQICHRKRGYMPWKTPV